MLILTLKHIINGTTLSLWDDIQFPLKLVQTAAVMEILHSMIGFVKSPWFTTFMQVFSRVWTLWAVMEVAPPTHQSIFLVMACLSWALVEVPRYLFYALNLFNAVPYPIFWLRYSLFAVLYPTGITGELGCMYVAGKYLQTSKQYVLFTIGGIEVSLLTLIIIVALTYIPGSPKMYGHMVKTRKKQLEELKSLKKKD